MMEPLPKDVNGLFTDVTHDNEMDEDSFEGWYIEKGHVRVFDAGSADGRDRCGELVVKAADGIAHTFKIHVNHQFPIPEDMYTLLGGKGWTSYQWAIGRRLPDQRFEKVSVIMMDDPDEAWQKLNNLSLTAYSCNVLI